MSAPFWQRQTQTKMQMIAFRFVGLDPPPKTEQRPNNAAQRSKPI